MNRIWESLLRALYGDDVFVSYARADGVIYAASLATELTERQFATRVDQWGTSPGEDVPQEIVEALSRSSMLVVISTRGAAKSKAIEKELRAFVASGRNIVPIDVDGEIDKADWWPIIRGLPITRDVLRDEGGEDKKDTGVVSASVLNRIEKTFNYTKKDRRLRLLSAVMSAILVTLVAASIYAGWTASGNRKAADAAKRRQQEAESARKNAQHDASVAREAAKAAQHDAGVAQHLKDIAVQEKATAEGLRAQAETLRDRAIIERGQAEQAEERSELMRHARTAFTAGDPTTALAATGSALRSADTPEARLLLGEIHNDGVPIEFRGLEQVQRVAVSPVDANLVVAIGMVMTPSGRTSRLVLWNASDGTSRHIDGLEYQAMVFSPDGLGLFVAALVRLEAGEGSGLRQKITREIALIDLDLSLRERARYVLPHVQSKEDGKEERTQDWEVRRIVDLAVDQATNRLLIAGFVSASYMAAVSNAMPHHYRAWADLNGLRIRAVVDTEHELSSFFSYRGHAVSLNDHEHIVVDGVAQIYAVSMKSGERTQIGVHTSSVNDVAASPSGRIVVAVGDDARLTIFTRDGSGWSRKVRELGGEGGADQIRFIDDSHVVLARQDLTITVVTIKPSEHEKDILLDFDVAWKAQQQKVFGGHSGRINDLTVSPDGRWIASASDDKTVRLWSSRADRRRVLRGSLRGVSAVSFTHDSKRVVVASLDGYLRMYDVLPQRELLLPVHPDLTWPEPRISDDEWTQGGGLTLAILREDWGFIRTISVGSDGFITGTSYDNTVTTWNSAGRLTGSARFDRNTVRDAPAIWAQVAYDHRVTVRRDKYDEKLAAPGIFTPDLTRFIHFSYYDKSVYVLDAHNRVTPVRFQNVYGNFVRDDVFSPASHRYVKFSHDGRYVAFPLLMERSYTLAIIDLRVMSVRIFRAAIMPDTFAFSSRGEIAIGGRSGEVYLYTLETDQTRVLARHAGPVRSVAWDPSGLWIASAGDDRSARLWSAVTGHYSEFPCLNPVEQVEFSRDGRVLFAASGLAVHGWFVPSGNLDGVLPARKAATTQKSNFESYPPQRDNFAFLVHRRGDDFKRIVSASLPANADHSTRRPGELVAVLTSQTATEGEKVRAAYELARYGDSALPYATKIAAVVAKPNEEDDVRTAAEEVLVKVSPDVQSVLASELAKTTDGNQRQELLRAIVRAFPNSPVIQANADELLSDSDGDTRLAAAKVVASPENLIAIGILEKALAEDADESAAEVLQRLGVAGLPALVHAVDQYPASQIAAKALASAGTSSVSSLLDLLKQRTGDEQKQVLRALGAMGPNASSAVPDLISMLKSQSSEASEVIETLEAIGPSAAEALPYAIDFVLNGPEKGNRISVYMGLYRFGPAADGPLRDALVGGHPKSGDLIYAVGELGPAAHDAVPALITRLRQADHFKNREIVEALGKIGPGAEAAIPELLAQLSSPGDLTQYEVFEALQKIQGTASAVVPGIVAFFEHEALKSPPERYLVTPEVLESFAENDVPQEIRLRLERMHDSIQREGPLFASIIQRLLSAEEWATYGERIMKASRVVSNRRCEELQIFGRATELVASYGNDARAAIPSLRRLREQRVNCLDIVKEIDDAIAKIGPE